jgi:hypothetical protein
VCAGARSAAHYKRGEHGRETDPEGVFEELVASIKHCLRREFSGVNL